MSDHFVARNEEHGLVAVGPTQEEAERRLAVVVAAHLAFGEYVRNGGDPKSMDEISAELDAIQPNVADRWYCPRCDGIDAAHAEYCAKHPENWNRW